MPLKLFESVSNTLTTVPLVLDCVSRSEGRPERVKYYHWHNRPKKRHKTTATYITPFWGINLSGDLLTIDGDIAIYGKGVNLNFLLVAL